MATAEPATAPDALTTDGDVAVPNLPTKGYVLSTPSAGTVLEQVDESEEPEESEVEPAAEEPAGFLTKIKAMVSPRKDTPAEEEDEVDIEDKEGEAEVKEKPPCCKPPSCSMPKCTMPKCSMPKCSMPKCFPQCTKKVEAPAEEAV